MKTLLTITIHEVEDSDRTNPQFSETYTNAPRFAAEIRNKKLVVRPTNNSLSCLMDHVVDVVQTCREFHP